MLNEKVKALLNDQVNKEMYSAYLYLDFSGFMGGKGLGGFATWYKKQAEEEMEHAFKIYDYIHANGEKVELLAIAKPNVALTDELQVLKEGLKHEEYVTSLIHNIYKVAMEEKDYRTMQFMDWFIKEQCEEEENAQELIDKFEKYGKDAAALYELDKSLGKRD